MFDRPSPRVVHGVHHTRGGRAGWSVFDTSHDRLDPEEAEGSLGAFGQPLPPAQRAHSDGAEAQGGQLTREPGRHGSVMDSM